MQLILGDCLDKIKELPSDSVDVVISDPPYGLAFMGKDWDKALPDKRVWQECFRVLKPGGYILAMSGSRTYHRLAVDVEDSGFITHPMIGWIYGSGFPKATDLGKQFDKGVERETTKMLLPNHSENRNRTFGKNGNIYGDIQESKAYITKPSTPQAKKWDGYKYGLQCLKPALEPIYMGQKPHLKPMIKNIEKWGVGAMNIDACRVEGKRHPANLILDGSEVVEDEFMKQTPNVQPCGSPKKTTHKDGMFGIGTPGRIYKNEDTSTASRFFTKCPFLYTPKASKRERNAGLEGMEKKKTRTGCGGKMPIDDQGKERDRFQKTAQNHHPTVKPISLMKWLITLVTPENATVLDPFMGSGTTGIACKNLNRNFIGIEKNEEYFKIAKERINEISK